MIINSFFTLEKGEELGTINPAFIPMVILIPFLLLSLFITFSVGASYFTKPTKRNLVIAVALIALIFFLAGSTEYNYITTQIDYFNGDWDTTNSTIYGLSPFNSYTNDWYFNESVFLMLHATAFALGSFMKIKEEPLDVSSEK